MVRKRLTTGLSTRTLSKTLLGVVLSLAVLATACGSETGALDEPECPSITLATHSSFALDEGTLDAFTEQTCVRVTQVGSGDAGQLVSTSILTKDNPTADVLFGIDNTFLQRGLDEGIFEAYESPALVDIPAALQLDDEHRVTPIDYSDICVNYRIDALTGPAPESLDDLLDPAYEGQFVTMNPETSSPGFGFLIATIARYGDGWEDYWQGLVDNGVEITNGWEDAYYGPFAPDGGKAIVTSYATSPPFEVIYADPPTDTAPTGVLFDSCFRQIEFAGILDGTRYPTAAGKLIDFMLSETYQDDLPFNQFVFPANPNAPVPDEFIEFGTLSDDPIQLDPAEIESNREAWITRWNEIVVG